MSEWKATDTTEAALFAGISSAPVKVTWTMLHQFAEAVARISAQRECLAIIEEIPGGSIVDPQAICDMLRERIADSIQIERKL